MKEKKLLTHEIPEQLKILKEKFGPLPQIHEIKQWYAGAGVYRSTRSCQLLANLLAAENEANLKRLTPQIVSELPPNPAYRHFQAVIAKHDLKMGRTGLNKFIVQLKEEMPDLWEGVNRTQAILSNSDHRLLKSMATTMNVPENAVAKICIRALALANIRGQINIAEILPVSKSMAQKDIEILIGSLNSIVG